jgi:signal transduction histidine kinase/PAS domain-containing protein
MTSILGQHKTILKMALIGLIIIAVPMGLTVSNFLARAALWENAHWTLATWFMTYLGYLGWRSASGDVRRVRGIMTLGLFSYVVGQILWDIQWAIGYPAFPAPSDIFYLGIAPFLIVGLISTFRSRISRADEIALNLDIAIIFLGLATAIFAWYGLRSSSLSILATVVLVAYPVVFLASGGAGLVGALMVRAQFRTLNSPYVLLIGLGGTGVCWVIWNSMALDQIIPPGTTVAYSFSLAHLVVGLGVGLWDSAPSANPRFNFWAKRILQVLPVVVIPMVVLIMESRFIEQSIFRSPIIIGGLIVITLAAFRQSLLLAERDRLLTRERDALERAEQELAVRKQMEKSLRETEQRYRALFEESPISIWEEDFSLVKQRIEVLRAQGVQDFQSYFDSHPEEVAECAMLVKVVDVNRAALKIYHAEKKEDLLKSLREILESSKSLTVFRGELVGIANGETVMYRENIDTTLTGELIDVSLSWQVAPGYEASLARVIVSIIDITERRRAEREREKLITDLETKNAEAETLRDSTAIVAATLEISEAVQSILEQLKRVIPYDSASVWLYKNNKSIMLGAIDLPHTDTVPEYTTLNAAEPDYPFWSENAAYILLDDIQENYPIFREPPLDYIHGWLAISLRTRGKLTGFISLDSHTPGKFTRHDAELALIFANQVSIALENARLFTELQVELGARQNLIEELENNNAELERFTYTVSHDLRSPLVTIKGFLGYLERSASTGNMESFRKDMARISGATDRMDSLLKDVLELSRIGRLVNKPKEVSFGELVQEAVEIVHGRLEARGITLHTQPNLPLVNVDKPRLIEVLQNLIDNAAKYMGEYQAQPVIEIGTIESDTPGKQTFFVRDNGMGIAPEYHERIFGLFDKLDAASDGTGIGLALVKRIIEFHGGRIWVESEVGKGSTFYFTLQKKMDDKEFVE